jgi:hypothetical protein
LILVLLLPGLFFTRLEKDYSINHHQTKSVQSPQSNTEQFNEQCSLVAFSPNCCKQGERLATSAVSKTLPCGIPSKMTHFHHKN